MTSDDPTVAICVRWQFEGFHHWPDAPVQRAYLRARHRHMFHAEVELPVSHNERDVEFHDLRDICVDICRRLGTKWDFEGASCETMATDIADTLLDAFDGPIRVAMFEDGENGAVVVRS